MKTCEKPSLEKISHEDVEIVKILAPLTDNPNAPNDIGRTPNQRGITPLAVAKNTEIREILKTYIK